MFLWRAQSEARGDHAEGFAQDGARRRSHRGGLWMIGLHQVGYGAAMRDGERQWRRAMLTGMVNIAVFAAFRCGSSVSFSRIVNSSGFVGSGIANARQKWQETATLAAKTANQSEQGWQGRQGDENHHRGHGGTRRRKGEEERSEPQRTKRAQRKKGVQDGGMGGREGRRREGRRRAWRMRRVLGAVRGCSWVGTWRYGELSFLFSIPEVTGRRKGHICCAGW